MNTVQTDCEASVLEQAAEELEKKYDEISENYPASDGLLSAANFLRNKAAQKEMKL